MRYIIDIEATNLLGPSLDYSVMPYRLTPEFKIHCVVIRNIDSNAVKTLVQSEITKANMQKALKDCTELIGHNIVGYDLPVLMLYGVLDYRIGYPGEPSILFGSPVEITDTLLWSKLLNADRFGGHSLEAWGKRLGEYKVHFDDWTTYSEDMLDYCIQDTNVNSRIYDYLIEEQGNHNWSRPYSMEIKLADLTLRQELFGFELDRELAERNLVDLTQKMQEIAAKVDPLLPPKKLGKAELAQWTPPQRQLKKDGTLTSYMQKFIERLNLTYIDWMKEIEYKGKLYSLPFNEPLETEKPATVEDIDTVKSYLMGLGWVPTEVKERDLVKNANKSKKTYQDIVDTIERYVEQTRNSLFQELRLEMLGTTMDNLQDFLMARIDGNKPIYVPTTPRLTIGLEKEICPNLVALGEKAEFVKDVVHYYTYRHRKNSIAGGAEDEDGEPETGFISYIREDGRVPTPADTLGANTGRYRHKIVCNIPRVTSLYGEQMRGMFRAGKGLWQLGFDFASLEARIMGHYVLPYEDGVALAESLVAEKPNDIHSVNARKLGISRGDAKSFSYAAIYGAQPKKLAKMLGVSESEAKRLYNEYWDAVPALKQLKEKVEKAWEAGGKKTIPGLDGRLLNTRSKHSLINVLFQSGGAIAAKWSTVLLAQEAEKRGILGDPFLHTKENIKMWLLIAYHDECQFAVHPKLLKVKVYSTDEEAEAARTDKAGAIGHGSKGPYVTERTEPVECIAEGIKQSCAKMKLRVDLGFEYIAGLSWKDCH
jgi:hypothetical protein